MPVAVVNQPASVDTPARRGGLEVAAGWVSRAWPPLVTLLALVFIWELWVRIFDVPLFLVPPPSLVGEVLVARAGNLAGHTWTTGMATLAAFGLAVAVGVPLGILVVESRLFVLTVYPLIVASQAVPKLAFAPLFLVWFGVGLTSKVLVGFLIAFFPVLIGTAVGLQSVRKDSLLLGRSLGFGGIETFAKIRVPYALPSIFGGFKIGITLAIVGAVVGEFLGATRGLGALLLIATGTLNTPLAFATLVLLALLGVALYGLVALIEYFVVPWRPAEPS